MEEEDVLCRFGTPLEPLEEDEIPSKKPITIEDQIVTDSNGRRRFHGAFTGGFSAGFWNTVGSLEGWKPQNFKSSRYEKAEKLAQTPTDFMDDEDLGEFGIAPQRIQTTDDFTPQESSTKDRKRKLQQPSGPIPGIPVLHQLLQPAREIVAIRLLKRMGWKAGQGIGARQTRREKKVAKERNARERYVMKKYGCDLGPLQGEKQPSKTSDGSSSDESDISDEEITFAPDDFDPYVCSIKDNSFGLGYSGLDRNPVLKKQQHIDLFGPFEVMGKGNKKLSIRGQAFGVGALEEEDEDIYAKDDMTKYDFSLDDSKNKQKKKQKMEDDKTIIDGFHAAKVDATKRKKVFRVHIPAGFKPRNWSVRKTRFEPLDEIKTALLKKKDEHKTKGLGRHDLNPDERGSILGENAGTSKPVVDDKKPSGKFDKKTYIQKVNEKYQSKEKEKDILEIIGSRIDNFTQGGIVNTSLEPPPSSVEVEVAESVKKENDKIQQDALNITKCLDKKPTIFKPFINNEPKQERYDKFLEADLSDDAEIDKFLASIQPLSMTDWDREMEKKEFLQARRIYKPLKGLMSERFVTESTATAERITTQKASTTDKKIEIIRTKTMWKPCAQLCKRFNVAEPFGGTMIDQKVTKRARFSVFDYLEVSVNKKDDFVTPVIIPTKSEKPKPIIHQDMTSKKRNDNSKLETEPTSSRISAKDIFTKASSSGDSAKSGEDSKDLPIKFNPTKKSDTDDLISKDKEVSHQHKTPKSALEKKIEESRTKHPSEKKDLFKLIFESSSEDEDDDSEATKEKMDEKLTANPQISKNVLHSLTKTAAEINILRNTSPPRGLFAFLLDKKPESSGAAKDSNTAGMSPENKTSTNSADKDLKKQDLTTRKSPEIEGIYGPMPPAMVPSIQFPSSQTIDVEDTPTSTEASEVDTKILKLLKKTKSKKIVEEWVEKPTNNKEKKKKKDKDKKRKKHKKDKKKHKDKK